MAKRLTIKAASGAARDMGLTIKPTGFEDFRVVWRTDAQSPGLGYYTPDLDDALLTAVAMHREADRLHRAECLGARELERAPALALIKTFNL